MHLYIQFTVIYLCKGITLHLQITYRRNDIIVITLALINSSVRHGCEYITL